MSDRTYRIALTIVYLLGVCALLLQPLWAILDPSFNGVMPYRGADESIYLIHLQEALLSWTADATNGIWAGVHNTTGMQSAFMERMAGWLFGWTGLDATVVALIVTALVGPTTMVLIALLLRKCGVSKLQSIAGGIFFFILIALTRRFFNPSVSLPLLLLALWLMWRWWDSQKIRDALLLGVVLGCHAGVYFWSWTFTWACFGLLFLFILDQYKEPGFRQRIMQYFVAGITSLLFAAPHLWKTYTNAHHPLFPESSLRMGLLYAREFESPPRSFFLVLLAAGTFFALRKKEDRRRYAPLICMAVASFVVMHQQFVHGRIMSFSSHYYFYITATSLLVLACFLVRRKMNPGTIIASIASLVFLAGAAHDYYGRIGVVTPVGDFAMRFQYLSPLITELKAGPRENILTDRATANLIASTTDDDVVFTDYCRILLVSNQEYIERFCLSEALKKGPINTEYIPTFNEEKSRAGREATLGHTDMMRSMTEEICPKVDGDIPAYLGKYEVSTVLWNINEQPDWDTNQEYLELRSEGDGWKLYDVRP